MFPSSSRIGLALACIMALLLCAPARSQEDIYKSSHAGGTRPGMEGRPVEIYVAPALRWKGPLPDVQLALDGRCRLRGEALSGPAWAGNEHLAVAVMEADSGNRWLQLCPGGGGSPAWQIPLADDPVAAPVADSERIYLAFASGRVEAFAVAEGEETWHVDLEGKSPADLALLGDRLLIGTGTGLTVLEAATGDFRFSLDLGASPVLPPAECAGQWILAVDSGSVRAIDPDGGRTVWQRSIEGVPAPPACRDGRVILGTSDRGLLALTSRRGHFTWKQRVGGIVAVRPILHAGGVYAAGLDGRVYGFKASSGHRMWAASVGERVRRTPVLVHNLLLIASAGETRLSVLHLPTGRALLEAEAPSEAAGWIGSPAALGSRLVLAADRKDSPDGLLLVYKVVETAPPPGAAAR